MNSRVGEIGPFWTDSSISYRQSVSGMPPGIGQIDHPLDGSQVLAKLHFLAAPTDPAGTRHWFPADGIGCLPFWLVVSSGAHIYIYIYIYIYICMYIRVWALHYLVKSVFFGIRTPCLFIDFSK